MNQPLRRLGERLPSARPNQVRAFICVRNEVSRLPFLLSFYRRAGVDWFFIVDNKSTDGTAELLATEPDCTVFEAAGEFGGSNYGMDWINTLLETYGIGHWRLFVDADELLTYAGDDHLDLPALCAHLASQGLEGLYAFMLDMYADGPVASTAYASGQDFRDVCGLFDPDYLFRDRFWVPGRPKPFPRVEVVGGPRLRRFYPEFHHRGALAYAIPRGLTQLRNSRAGRALGLPSMLRRATSPPLLSKLPLTFGAPGRIYVNNHRTVPLRLASMTGILLHFKFFADFHHRVSDAISEGQHFDGGTEYAPDRPKTRNWIPCR